MINEKDKPIDYELIAAGAHDVSKLHQVIMNGIPEEHNSLLHHLSAAAIHLALFMRDVVDVKNKTKSSKIDKEDLFLSKCGCKDEILK